MKYSLERLLAEVGSGVFPARKLNGNSNVCLLMKKIFPFGFLG
jgi:hypothetical protein